MCLKRRINFLASHLRHFRSPSISNPFFFSSCFKPFHSSLHSALVPPLVLPPSLPPSLPLSGPPDCEPKGHLSPESPVYLNRSPPFDIHLLGDGRRKRGRTDLAPLGWRAGCSSEPEDEMSLFPAESFNNQQSVTRGGS